MKKKYLFIVFLMIAGLSTNGQELRFSEVPDNHDSTNRFYLKAY